MVSRWFAMLHPLDRKALRDAWRLRGQLAAAALVAASGVAVLVMSHFLFATLSRTQEAYYDRYRFADVFASASRAPNHLVDEIALIPGVRAAESRITVTVQLDMEGLVEPVSALLVSLPRFGRPRLNDVAIVDGRDVDVSRENEALVSRDFAEARGLGPGDSLAAIINGRRRELDIVGVALSPEFVYATPPGAFLPTPENYAVMWMSRDTLEAAYDREGAFNDLAVSLTPDARVDDVIDAIDVLLRPYGGAGAYARADQLSHAFLQSEIDSLVSMGSTIPPVFLLVSAFMLYVLLTRLIETEREQIGLMKAFGYSNAEVSAHYLKIALVPGLAGGAIGCAFGLWAGDAAAGLYTKFYSFPFMIRDAPASVFATGFLVAAATASFGAMFAVRRAARLAPAEAMRAPAPARYRRGWIDRLGLARMLSTPSRIILRNISRRPLRSGLTSLGIAAGCATIVASTFMADAWVEIIDVQFGRAQRQDVTLSFTRERSARILNEVADLPGVIAAEGQRAVPAMVRFGARVERTGVQGTVNGADLSRPLNENAQPIDLPPEGLVLSRILADQLGVSAGQQVTLETLTGRRPTLELTIAAIANDYVGASAYMRLDALNRVMGDGPTVTSAVVSLDSAERAAFYEAVRGSPSVMGASDRQVFLDQINETIADNMLTYTMIFSVFAGSIAFGVVYNAARISLSERGRELASLRVLGFTNGEVSYVLLGELALLTLAALPLGAFLGYLFANLILSFMPPDLFHVPLMITRARYATAMAFTAGFAALSGLVVRRRIDRLDLIEVLKTRE